MKEYDGVLDNLAYLKPSYATDDLLSEEAAIPCPPSLPSLSSVLIVLQTYLRSLPLKRKSIQCVPKASVEL